MFGIPVPFHRNFEEVNLRFYVRRFADGGWRRGVVFVRELVPRGRHRIYCPKFLWRTLRAVPMSHDRSGGWPVACPVWLARRGGSQFIEVPPGNRLRPSSPGPRRNSSPNITGVTLADRMEPRNTKSNILSGKYMPGLAMTVQVEVARLYGAEFVPALSTAPASCFMAVGSDVVVRRPCFVRAA